MVLIFRDCKEKLDKKTSNGVKVAYIPEQICYDTKVKSYKISPSLVITFYLQKSTDKVFVLSSNIIHGYGTEQGDFSMNF